MDANSLLWQLRSGLITETSVPNIYLFNPEIAATIKQYNWITRPSTTTAGWTTLIRQVSYSN